MLLTDSDLTQLTGRKHKRLRIEWLRSHGVRFTENLEGNIVTTWEQVNRAFESKASGPNWSAA